MNCPQCRANLAECTHKMDCGERGRIPDVSYVPSTKPGFEPNAADVRKLTEEVKARLENEERVRQEVLRQQQLSIGRTMFRAKIEAAVEGGNFMVRFEVQDERVLPVLEQLVLEMGEAGYMAELKPETDENFAIVKLDWGQA